MCRKHWPNSAKYKIVRGEKCLIDPPSVYENVSKSCIPAKLVPPRSTTRALSSFRNQHPDEIDEFLTQDAMNLLEIEILSIWHSICWVLEKNMFYLAGLLQIRWKNILVSYVSDLVVHISLMHSRFEKKQEFIMLSLLRD